MLTNCSCEIPYAFIKLLDVQQSCNGAFTFGIVTEILASKTFTSSSNFERLISQSDRLFRSKAISNYVHIMQLRQSVRNIYSRRFFQRSYNDVLANEWFLKVARRKTRVVKELRT